MKIVIKSTWIEINPKSFKESAVLLGIGYLHSQEIKQNGYDWLTSVEWLSLLLLDLYRAEVEGEIYFESAFNCPNYDFLIPEGTQLSISDFKTRFDDSTSELERKPFLA